MDERIVWIGTRRITLQDAPFELLAFLYERSGSVVRNLEIIRETDLTLDTIRQRARRIRRAVEPDPQNPVYLVTIRGVGLRLDNVIK